MARHRDGWDGFRRFPPSVPRKVEGGIRAHSKRGAFASSWWGRRWIKVLEGFGLAARLRRGRSYARKGQVLSLEVEPGRVTATVQGSRARPYRVEMRLDPLPADAWGEVVARLAADLGIGARLLAGEMPPEVEGIVTGAGAHLFPDRLRDLETSCSCPDWSNPCKHIAAVHYLLAEELDRDPFLLLRLRGMEREKFTEALLDEGERERGGPAESARSGDVDPGDTLLPEAEGGAGPEASLWPVDPDAFWGRGRAAEEGEGMSPPPPPRTDAALVRRLGTFPFWRGERPFLEAMREIYGRASAQARELLEDWRER